MEKQLQRENAEFREQRQQISKREHIRLEALGNFRKGVIQAEETIRRMEARQARQRENFATKRQTLQARLQQLEEMSLPLEPADRLRNVEHKLDALRREVNQLRRAVERQSGEPRKKP